MAMKNTASRLAEAGHDMNRSADSIFLLLSLYCETRNPFAISDWLGQRVYWTSDGLGYHLSSRDTFGAAAKLV